MAYDVDFWYLSQDACQISTDFTPFCDAEKESIYMKTSDFFKMVERFTDPDLERKAKAFDEIKEFIVRKLKEEEEEKPRTLLSDYDFGLYQAYDNVDDIIQEHLEDE